MRIITDPGAIPAHDWDALARSQPGFTPFLRHAFLHALHASGSATAETGWTPCFVTLWRAAAPRTGMDHAAPDADARAPAADQLCAAVVLYAKTHSYGEYVFDWAWADAYARNGLDYYPKLLSAIPFTPVQGTRLLACDDAARAALLDGLLGFARDLAGPPSVPPPLPASTQATASAPRQAGGGTVSSLHILFPEADEAALLQDAGLMLRQGVQFHWHNAGHADFEAFLATLTQKRRKNIRAERRKVAEAGVRFRHVPGSGATGDDWRFFHRCYRTTYAAHRSTPYLNLDFFLRIARTMPENLHLVIGEHNGAPVSSALLVWHRHRGRAVLYGRYWGAVAQLPCLHFETAYYQPLEFCIAQRIDVFEGGAQGEHKMARGFVPVTTRSAHWLAHPAFADAVQRFLSREAAGIAGYVDELREHLPYRPSPAPASSSLPSPFSLAPAAGTD